MSEYIKCVECGKKIHKFEVCEGQTCSDCCKYDWESKFDWNNYEVVKNE